MWEDLNRSRQVNSSRYTWVPASLQVEKGMTEIERWDRDGEIVLPPFSSCIPLSLFFSLCFQHQSYREREQRHGLVLEYFPLCEHGSKSGLQVCVYIWKWFQCFNCFKPFNHGIQCCYTPHRYWTDIAGNALQLIECDHPSALCVITPAFQLTHWCISNFFIT